MKQKYSMLLIAVVAWTGVIVDFGQNFFSVYSDGKSIFEETIRLLGYFTILTNIAVALLFSTLLTFPSSKLGKLFSKPAVFGSIVLAIVVVGIIYHLLLRQHWDPKGIVLFADIILHTVVPVSTLAYWLFYPPKDRILLWMPFAWCVYPISYLFYAMVRGAIINRYPYYFIDASEIGVTGVVQNSLMLTGVFLALGFALLGLTRLRIRIWNLPH